MKASYYNKRIKEEERKLEYIYNAIRYNREQVSRMSKELKESNLCLESFKVVNDRKAELIKEVKLFKEEERKTKIKISNLIERMYINE